MGSLMAMGLLADHVLLSAAPGLNFSAASVGVDEIRHAAATAVYIYIYI
jgi:hypothetical protein